MIAEAVQVLGTPKGENVEHGSNRRDWKYHVQRINAAWSKRAEGVIETGQALIDARGELEKKTFRSLVESNELPFNHTTAFKLIAIVQCQILVSHVKQLPESWGTLYELTLLPHDMLRAKLADGSVNPKTERKDVASWRAEQRGKVEVDGKAVEHLTVREKLRVAERKIATLETKLKSAGGSLFDLALDSAEDIGKILADNMSEGRFDVAVRAAKAQYKAKRQKPAG